MTEQTVISDRQTFQEYILGTPSTPSLKVPRKADEIICPVCMWPGKELVLDDRLRVYHPGRLHPCRAPEWYKAHQEPKNQLMAREVTS